MSTLSITVNGGATPVEVSLAPVSVLVSQVGVQGPPGESEFQVSATHIQWRQVGAADWVDLVALSALTGADGVSVELQATATHIQWRQVGAATWTDLIALSALMPPVVAVDTAAELPATPVAGTFYVVRA